MMKKLGLLMAFALIASSGQAIELVYEGFDTSVDVGLAISNDVAWTAHDTDAFNGTVRDGLEFTGYTTTGKSVATYKQESDYRTTSLTSGLGDYGTLYMSGLFRARVGSSTWGNASLTMFNVGNSVSSGALAVGLTTMNGSASLRAFAGEMLTSNTIPGNGNLAVTATDYLDDTTYFVLAKFVVTDAANEIMDISLMIIENGSTIPATEPGTWDATFTGATYAGYNTGGDLNRLTVAQSNTPGTNGDSNRSDEFRMATTYADALLPTQGPSESATLSISEGSGSISISWLPNLPGYILQEKPDLLQTNWVDSASNSTNHPITIPVTAPAMFYRVIAP